MTNVFQPSVFQALAYQVGRLFPRKLDCALNVVPRCAVAAAVSGPVALALERPFGSAVQARIAALSSVERVDPIARPRDLILSVYAVERSAP